MILAAPVAIVSVDGFKRVLRRDDVLVLLPSADFLDTLGIPIPVVFGLSISMVFYNVIFDVNWMQVTSIDLGVETMIVD